MELEEIYKRLNELEKQTHTLEFRADAMDEHNFPTRVANLEPLVLRIREDVNKIESSVDSIRDDLNQGLNEVKTEIAGMKSIVKGFLICISAAFTLVTALPPILELLK